MGWQWNLGFKRYGASWREHRRGFHQYFNSTAVESYVTVLEPYGVKFLEGLLQRPDNFDDLTRLYVKYFICLDFIHDHLTLYF